MTVSRMGLIALLVTLGSLLTAPSHAAEDAQARPAAQPGFVSGRILGEDGKAVSTKGVKVEVVISGVSTAGEKVQYLPVVGADGSWRAKLVPGTYRAPSATIDVPFNGHAYTYDLIPDSDGGDFAAADGLARDFIWKASGPKPGVVAPHPDKPGDYFGAPIDLRYSKLPNGPRGKQIGPLGPKGTRVIFTATPVGKLIDGTEGQAKSFDLLYNTAQDAVTPMRLHDLLVGNYTVTAKMVAPGGAETPLLLMVGGTQDEFAPSVQVGFSNTPGSKVFIAPVIHYTRRP